MANERIEVRIPDRMTVDAPRTDALIDSLVEAFGALSKMLQASLVEIAATLQTLKGIPDQLGSFQTVVQQQLGLQIRVQLEAQVQMRLAAILSAGKQQAALIALKAEVAAALPRDVDRITSRATRRIAEAAEETARSIRLLDSHVLDILEQIYPRQIQERFSIDSAAAFEMLAAHASHAMTARAAAIDGSLRDVQFALDEIEVLRSDAMRALENLDWGQEPQPGWNEAAFFVVEIEEGTDGPRSEHVILVGAQEVPEELAAQVLRRAALLQESSAVTLLPADSLRRLSESIASRRSAHARDAVTLTQARVEFITN